MPNLKARDLLWVALIGLAIQAIWAWRLEGPAYADAYYYAANGRRLAAGAGLTEPFVWQYLDVTPGSPLSVLPAPSHSYWMPLASFLAAAGFWLSDSFRAAQVPFWLLAGTLPALAYWLSWRLFQRRGQAWTAALLTATGGFFSAFWNQPETFAPFAWLAASALLAMGQGGAQRRRQAGWWLLAGLLTGLAHLTRADGLLLLPVGLLVALLARRGAAAWLGSSAALLTGYAVTAGPWLVRNWLVLGRPLSSAGTQTLFLTSYDDLFAFGRHIDAATYLDWGWQAILQSKLQGLSLGLQTLVVIAAAIFLAPFIALAWRAAATRDDSRAFVRPLFWYTLALFLAMTLLYTFPGQRGGFFHSAAALWPWAMALAPTGIAIGVEAVARRRPAWRAEQATVVFSAGAVVLALLLSVAAGARSRSTDDIVSHGYPLVAAVVPAGATIVARDPAGFYFQTGRSAIVVPNDPPAGVLAAADLYGAGYLLLDANHPAALGALYDGAETAPRFQLLEQWPDFGLKLYEIQP